MRNYSFILLILSMLFNACDLKQAPKCDDETVKNLAIKIINKKIKEQLKTNPFAVFNDLEGGVSGFRTPFDVLELSNLINKRANEIVKEKFPQWEGIQLFDKGFDEYKSYKDQLCDSLQDDMINSLNLKIQSIRIVSTNNEIKKCECEADVYQEDTKVRGITYTAQMTEDKTVYVTVYFP